MFARTIIKTPEQKSVSTHNRRKSDRLPREATRELWLSEIVSRQDAELTALRAEKKLWAAEKAVLVAEIRELRSDGAVTMPMDLGESIEVTYM